MKRTLLSSIAAALMIMLSTTASQAQQLQFNSDGKFKIAQITDTHYKWGKGASKKAIECIKSVIESEKPDLIIFTGDQVWSNNVHKSLEALMEPVVASGTPFAAIFGNHDHQFDMTNDDQYDFYLSNEGCVMPKRRGPGKTDYTIEVKSSDGQGIARVLYCMDTHSYNRKAKGYDFLTYDQIGWYRSQSDSYTSANGGQPVPALLFIHIPLQEYALAYDADNAIAIGTKGEKVSCSVLNSGMFQSLKEKGDIVGVFCGHDHDNDFAVEYRDILLAYGRYSGGKTVYNHLGTNGARIIELDEQRPGEITTWIRLSDGKEIQRVTFPQDYKKKK